MKKGRTTVYNKITSPAKLKQVNEENLLLEDDFLSYLSSIDKAESTIRQYRANLHVFWCWNLDFNNNKFFVDLTKREISRFQNHALKEWKWSPKRIRTVKATLSSLSNYIEDMLDDDYKNYKPIINKIQSPADEPVREKTVMNMEDVQWLLDKLVEREDYMRACMLALAIFSGKRKAELPQFKVSYFDEKNLICGGTLYKTPEKIRSKGRGSKGKMIDVFILAKPFKPYLDLWLEQRKILGIESEWLFPDYEYGEWHCSIPIPLTTMESWAAIFNNMLEERGKCFYFHAARHFFTTYLLEQNLPDNVVQNIQQWSSSDMVRIYDDRSTEAQLEQYFTADGIVVERKGLNDL